MKNIEIPYVKDRNRRYRFFEMLPGLMSWSVLALPFLLSFISATLAASFVLFYLLVYFVRAVGVSVRALQGHKIVTAYKKLDWQQLLREVEAGEILAAESKRPRWHFDNIARLKERPVVFRPSELLHVAMIATYNESREVLEPTIQSILASHYDMDQVMLVIAYEERGGAVTKKIVEDLVEEYGPQFSHAMAICHPDKMPGEVIGKGGNITYAGREVQKYIAKKKIDPLKVVVTTLDADNRPDKKFFAALSFVDKIRNI